MDEKYKQFRSFQNRFEKKDFFNLLKDTHSTLQPQAPYSFIRHPSKYIIILNEMSDQDEQVLQFQTKRRRLTKNQQIYGDFYQAYEEERPSFGNPSNSRRAPSSKMMNFKSGDVINPNSNQVEINVPEKAKKKKVTFEEKEKVHTFERGEEEAAPPGMWTMESFLSSRADHQVADSEESEETKQQENVESNNQPMKLSNKIKTCLKLYKYSEYGKPVSMKDYGLPESFGKQKPKQPPKPKKTVEQVTLQHEYTKNYGVGFKMMAKMGFKVGEGLGKDGKGMTAPVEAVIKTSLVAQDQEPRRREPEVIVVEKDEGSEEEETKQPPLQKGVTELFEYFSQNQQVNNLLKYLKNQYQALQSSIHRQQDQVQRLEQKTQLLQSTLLQTQNQQQTITQQLTQLQQIKTNLFSCDKYPHHALRFNIDLLLVKQCLQKVKPATFEQLYTTLPQVFDEIAGMKAKLTRIYLSKEKENIRNFTKDHVRNFLYEKVVDVEGLEDQAEISEADLEKINKFARVIIEDNIIGLVTPRFTFDNLKDNQMSQKLIEIVDAIVKLEPETAQQLSKYVYCILNQYLKYFTLDSPLRPDLLIFPWFPLIHPKHLDLESFVEHLYSLPWSPLQATFLSIIQPWQPYLSGPLWQDLVNFCIAPTLLKMLEGFTVTVESMPKVKALMRYANVLTGEQWEAVLEEVIIALEKTWKEKKGKESDKEMREWLNGWRRILVKITMQKGVLERIDTMLRV